MSSPLAGGVVCSASVFQRLTTVFLQRRTPGGLSLTLSSFAFIVRRFEALSPLSVPYQSPPVGLNSFQQDSPALELRTACPGICGMCVEKTVCGL